MISKKPDIPSSTLTRWQRTIDLLARITETPAVLITKAHTHDLENYVCSDSPKNPYRAQDTCPRHSGFCCDWVVEHNKPLLISDATSDPHWHNNPDLIHDLSFYCGYPLNWPDGEIFGTLCVLDQFDNALAKKFLPLQQEFQLLLQDDLATVLVHEQLKAKHYALEQLLEKQSTDA